MTIHLRSAMLRVPILATVSCALFVGILLPAEPVSADDPPDIEADAEIYCEGLAAQGYDTTGCVDTYLDAYAGNVDLGPDTSPYFEEPGSEIQLPCTESVEYQAYLEDPFAGTDPCAVPPAEPDPCVPIPGVPGLPGGPGELEPNPCPVPVLPVLAAPAQPQKLTWKGSFTTKLYIADFPINKCGTPTWVKRGGPQQIAAYAAFCLATAQSYKENPANGNNVNPLDARIWAKADLEIVCVANKALPDSGSIEIGGTAAGKEVGPFGGVVEVPRRRNELAANGGYGFVTWGRPNLALEPGFVLAGGLRTQLNIWNKVSGTATCKTGNDGKPSLGLGYQLEGTGFPSHKLWWNGKLSATVPQGPMSILWDLPAVPQA